MTARILDGKAVADQLTGEVREGVDARRAAGHAPPGLAVVMTASVVIGSSIVMTVQEGPTVFGVPLLLLLGLFGYLLAFCNSIWIIYGIWRSSKNARK